MAEAGKEPLRQRVERVTGFFSLPDLALGCSCMETEEAFHCSNIADL